MPVPSSAYGQQGAPSCFDRIKVGFMMGFCVGMASGAIFGGFSALRYVKEIWFIVKESHKTYVTFLFLCCGDIHISHCRNFHNLLSLWFDKYSGDDDINIKSNFIIIGKELTNIMNTNAAK